MGTSHGLVSKPSPTAFQLCDPGQVYQSDSWHAKWNNTSNPTDQLEALHEISFEHSLAWRLTQGCVSCYNYWPTRPHSWKLLSWRSFQKRVIVRVFKMMVKNRMYFSSNCCCHKVCCIFFNFFFFSSSHFKLIFLQPFSCGISRRVTLSTT